ncbi:MAG: histidine phosphatase family protein, partial [Acidimicrobiia bacterium]|nr:histidine phosphatase family protein [Acidimicrobiia bacterium]
MPTRRRPKPTLVLLVRHGHTPTTGKLLPGRAKGLHLSDDGRKQAQAVADRIATLPKVDAVYASPLERTRETAAPIAKAHGMRVRPDKRLLEVDVGEWTGWELKKAAKTEEWKTVQ